MCSKRINGIKKLLNAWIIHCFTNTQKKSINNSKNKNNAYYISSPSHRVNDYHAMYHVNSYPLK